jgi:hypothetical protein
METILDLLARNGFDWSVATVERLVAALGLKPASSKGRRTTWRDGQRSLSIYKSGDDIESVEVTLWARDADENDVRFNADSLEWRKEYDRLLAVAIAHLRPPSFEGRVNDVGFPDDQDAVRLALWPQPWGRLMLKLLQEGREIPLRVAVTLAR